MKQNLARWVLLALVLGMFGTAVSFACTSEYPGDATDGGSGSPADGSHHTPHDVLGTG